MALKRDGTVWTWGINDEGQLGNGSNDSSNVPIRVKSLKNIKAIAGGSFHAIALQKGGKIWTWGNNLFGQLGNGTNVNSTIPTQVKIAKKPH